MSLHKNILYLVYFVTFYFTSTTAIRNKNLVPIESGLANVSACSIGLLFFTTINNTSDEDFIVELISDECCIHSGDSLDCDSVEIIGETVGVLQKGKVKTFRLVAPVLDPFEREGYCSIHLDSRPIDKRNLIMRDTIKIEFDTKVKNANATHADENIRVCKNEDEDPLNDCKPVNCDTYYNGKKPMFDKKTRKCVEASKCKEKISGDGKFFDPISNRCIDGEHIDIDDIDYIKSISHNRHPKDVIIIESDNANTVGGPSEYSTNITDQALSPIALVKTTLPKKNDFSLYLETFLPNNKYSIILLGIVFLSQCVIICTMLFCLTKRTSNLKDKKVERKYFNYRQDASVTTPLITTSNIDTETACEFISESSTLDRKIQCYKACQKERNKDAKFSMSDDILSKCLNRRNWNTTAKSDTVSNVHNLNDATNFEWHANKDKQTVVQEMTIPERNTSENVAQEKVIEYTIEEPQNDCGCRKIKEDYTDSDSSEKLIQTLDYNMIRGRNRGVTEEFAANNTIAYSIVSTEKGAQASFSKDSADDFLSERGIFMTGDGLSKYSFTPDFTPESSLLTSTSKTSKNNILKNVLSYLSKKSKALTTSDPGMKKCKGKDLELIHMSQASMHSSSASEYRKLNKVKVAKDSRTSF